MGLTTPYLSSLVLTQNRAEDGGLFQHAIMQQGLTAFVQLCRFQKHGGVALQHLSVQPGTFQVLEGCTVGQVGK